MPKQASDELKSVFKDLAEHTAPKCGSCLAAYACCSSGQCHSVKEEALTLFGVTLEPTGTLLPFLGPNGCTVEPHLRPICSVHVCERHLTDDAWTQRYYELRDKSEDLLYEHVCASEA